MDPNSFQSHPHLTSFEANTRDCSGRSAAAASPYASFASLHKGSIKVMIEEGEREMCWPHRKLPCMHSQPLLQDCCRSSGPKENWRSIYPYFKKKCFSELRDKRVSFTARESLSSCFSRKQFLREKKEGQRELCVHCFLPTNFARQKRKSLVHFCSWNEAE